MLYLLASGQAQTRQDVAQLLGGHHHTISRWLARYDAGGLDASLALYVPAGRGPVTPKHPEAIQEVQAPCHER